MVGTLVGGVAIVVLTSFLSQDRVGFLLGVALWGAACGFVATILENFMSYAAALSGVTAMVIAGDALGATGGASGEVFTLAITRTSEICIGIVCAGVVLAMTDFGTARRRLARTIAALGAEIVAGLAETLSMNGDNRSQMRSARRDLIARTVSLSPIIDEAIGETADLRYRARALQGAVDGLFGALSSWRTIGNCLEGLPPEQRGREGTVVLRALPLELLAPYEEGRRSLWIAEPSLLRRRFQASVRILSALSVSTPSLRLLTDRTAEGLLALSRTLDVLALLGDPAHEVRPRHAVRLNLPDLLPPLVNAVRIFVTIVVAELFWIATAWPSGAKAMIFAAILSIRLSPREDAAYAAAKSFALGIGLTAILAGIVKFAALPAFEDFSGLSLILGFVLLPLGALSTQSWQPLMFTAATSFFGPLLAPANQMTYDFAEFSNSAVAIVAGCGWAVVAMLLVPPLPAVVRVRRALAATLRDLRRLAAANGLQKVADWEARMYRRLSQMPAQAEPLQLARLVAMLTIGAEMIRLHRLTRRFGRAAVVDKALLSVVCCDSSTSTRRLAEADSMFARIPECVAARSVTLRARGSVRAIFDAVAQHRDYFDARAMRCASPK
jgi:uncharacterized membrane protein YccC